MKKLCLIVLSVIAVLFAGIYALITDAQTTILGVDIGGAGTTMSEPSAPSDYSLQAQLKSGNAGNEYSTFDVRISGNTAVVSSNDGAYVYVRTGTVWSQQALLAPSDGISQIAIEGDTIVLGASGATVNGNAGQGAVNVFVRNVTGWTAQQRLTASDGAASDNFGRSVAISGETIIVGASTNDVGANIDQGSAYVYLRSGTVWTEQAILLAEDGAARDSFGSRVAIDGNTAVISRSSPFATLSAAVYIFVRSGTVWQQQQKLSVCEPSGANLCNFGNSISINGDNLAVGNWFLNAGSSTSVGGVYVFARSAGTWTQQQKLLPDVIFTDSYFGSGVSIYGQTLVVSAQSDFNGPGPGSAYVYTRSGSQWVQQQKLQVSGVTYWNAFGQTLSFDGSSILVGAPRDSSTRPYVGAAYVFTQPAPAPVSISGRVTTPDGRGLRNVVVSLTDSLGLRRMATTSSFGLYSFDNVLTGNTYIISAASKRYRFTPATMAVNGNLTGVDFVGLE